MRRETLSRSRESCCQTFFPMTLAALHLFLTIAGRSATMLSTSSSPFTQMGRWQDMGSDRMAICSTTSYTSGRQRKADAPPLSARRNRIGVTDQAVHGSMAFNAHMISFLSTIAIGFFLGIQHATNPDDVMTALTVVPSHNSLGPGIPFTPPGGFHLIHP
jgi:hypothetical protein